MITNIGALGSHGQIVVCLVASSSKSHEKCPFLAIFLLFLHLFTVSVLMYSVLHLSKTLISIQLTMLLLSPTWPLHSVLKTKLRQFSG